MNVDPKRYKIARRYHASGQDNWHPRGSSGLSREYVHGPLQPMHDDAHPASLGLLFVFFLLFGAATALAIWGFLT